MQLSRSEFLVGSVLIGVVLFATIAIAFTKGNPWIALGTVWMASPIPLMTIATLIEHRSLSDVANLQHGSLALLIGDIILLPAMAAFTAVGRRQVNLSGWAGSWWWLFAALAIGVIAGLTFHHMDQAVYAEAAFNSPTKLWHDLITYPILFGGLTFGFVPIIRQASTVKWFATAMIALWFLAVVSDVTWHRLNPVALHILYIWPKG